MKKFILLIAVIYSISVSSQVTPRNPNTATPKTKIKIAPVKSNTTISTGVRPVKIGIGNKNMLLPTSNLKRVNRYIYEFDSNPPKWRKQFEDGSITYTNTQANWNFDFVWFNIPRNAVSAKFEISDIPFSINSESSSQQIVETKIIPVEAKDSIFFTINYSEKRTNSNSNIRENNTTQVGSKIRILNTSNKSIFGTFEKTGIYYVRLTPIDSNDKAIGIGGNTIRICPEKPFEQPVATNQEVLGSDYEITAIYYTQPHLAETSFSDCQIVTGYNESISDAFWTPEIKQNFKTAFPIGRILCPEKEKEDSWYNKALSSVENVTKTIINSAASAYNETKSYVKGKIATTICGDNTDCQKGVETGFDVAMAYAGIPPSIPNFDEMSKLAKGQIIQTLAQQAAQQAGYTCDENCVALLEAGYDEIVDQNSNHNTGSGNYLNYKPDPRGQYRLPYVQFEITRVRNTYQGNPLFVNLFVQPKVSKTFSEKTISSNLIYQQIQLPIPYLQKVGDKVTMVAVLKPQYSYLKTSCSDKKIIDIVPTQQICAGFNVIETINTPQSSSGYYSMFDNSTIKFEMNSKINVKNGISSQFNHHN